jgi:hypothetical protein
MQLVLGSSRGQHGRVVQRVTGMKNGELIGEDSAVAINGKCGAIAHGITARRVDNDSFAPMSNIRPYGFLSSSNR